jgi:crossover junction endodeoxyribonuclease RusA
MRLVLPYPPSLNRLYRVVRGRPILSREAREYRARVQVMLLAEGYRPTSSPVAPSIWLYRPRRTGDADNALKALLDALNGILWLDDSQVVELHLYRLDDKNNPRVELRVELRS